MYMQVEYGNAYAYHSFVPGQGQTMPSTESALGIFSSCSMVYRISTTCVRDNSRALCWWFGYDMGEEIDC